jgi:hypothetical protein
MQCVNARPFAKNENENDDEDEWELRENDFCIEVG